MAAEQGKETKTGQWPTLNIERIYSTTIPADELAQALAGHFRAKEFEAQVFAVNPNTDEVEGVRCYQDLKSIPGGVDAVVIGTRPEIAEDTMRECAELGIKQVWMHRGPGAGSVSDAATGYGRAHGITVIDGGCPLMFGPTADLGHKIMRLVYAGHVPKQV